MVLIAVKKIDLEAYNKDMNEASNLLRDSLSPAEQLKYDLSLKMYGDVFVWEGKVLNPYVVDYLSKTGNLINNLMKKGLIND